MILALGRRSAARWLSRGHRTWRVPARRRPARAGNLPPAETVSKPWARTRT